MQHAEDRVSETARYPQPLGDIGQERTPSTEQPRLPQGSHKTRQQAPRDTRNSNQSRTRREQQDGVGTYLGEITNESNLSRLKWISTEHLHKVVHRFQSRAFLLTDQVAMLQGIFAGVECPGERSLGGNAREHDDGSTSAGGGKKANLFSRF